MCKHKTEIRRSFASRHDDLILYVPFKQINTQTVSSKIDKLRTRNPYISLHIASSSVTSGVVLIMAVTFWA